MSVPASVPVHLGDRRVDPRPGEPRRLLAARLLEARRNRTRTREPVMVPRNQDSYPCSPQQRRFWLANQLDLAGSATPNAAAGVRLRGRLEVAALSAAVSAVVARHEALRTVYLLPDPARPEPHQHVLPATDARLAPDRLLGLVDLTGLPVTDREPRATILTGQALRERFNLTTGPLLRATLYRLTLDDHVLLLVCHHITVDAYTLGTVLGELAERYAAQLAGAADPPPPALQYLDYAAWAATRLAPDERERRRAWWRRRLAPPHPELVLPFGRGQPGGPGNQPPGPDDSASATLEPGVLDRLCQAGGRAATPFTALLALLKVLLARYTGQPDLTVGTFAAGRDLPAWEPVVGCFGDLLPLRTDLTGAATFAEVLARVRAGVAGTLAHRLPFDEVVAVARPDRSPHAHPLFPVMFTLMENRTYHGDWPGLAASYWPHEAHPDGLALSIEAVPPGDGRVWMSFRHRPGTVEPGAAARLAGHFETLASGLAADPARPLDRVPVALPREHAELRTLGRGPAVPVPHVTILEQFRQRARDTPDAPAVTCGEATLSYHELGMAVDTLAARLATAGAGSGSLVGVCLDRSPELVVAPLAVWATGAAWVPLDPDYPPDRQAFVLADAGATVVVTRRALAPRLPATGATVVYVDDPDPAPAARVAGRPAPRDVAYVLHTSGSTGRPKGVAVTHRNLGNFLQAMARLLDARPEHRWLAVTSLAFDIAGLELWLPLAAGASLVMVPEPVVRDGCALAELARGTSHIQTTPSTWQLLLAGGLTTHPGLVALVGGEALPVPLARQLRAVADRLINVYGPTETTIWSTSWEVPAAGTEVSIGIPIDNTQVYVCDQYGRPTARGVPGELHIGGDGVAHGYLGRPALTAQRFVPDPAGPPGSRRYRTGDRVRWRHDGTLEFLGRMDDQVKLRGHRIEPGEIETRLLEHPDVAQAAVVARPDHTGNVILAAYFVAAARTGPDPAVLRRHLAGSLPAYLLPSHLLQLDALPLTRNGKLDRAALPLPPRRGSTAYTPPRTDIEQLVADVWAQVLEADRVGATDDFFDLGGHSLLALQVILRLRDAVGLELAVRLCFEHPTVAELAAAVEAEVRAEIARLPAAEADWILTGEGAR